MRRTPATLSILTAIVLFGLSSAAFAEDRVVHVLVRADSEHPGNEVFRAMDGNRGSMWHSGWEAPAAMKRNGSRRRTLGAIAAPNSHPQLGPVPGRSSAGMFLSAMPLPSCWG